MATKAETKQSPEIEKLFVGINEAITLLNMGFKAPCVGYYTKERKLSYRRIAEAINNEDGTCSVHPNKGINLHPLCAAPLRQQAVSFLAEKFNVMEIDIQFQLADYSLEDVIKNYYTNAGALATSGVKA